jgi:hypothetical protein
MQPDPLPNHPTLPEHWDKTDQALTAAATLMPAVDSTGHHVGEDLTPLDQRTPVATDLNQDDGHR